MITLTRIIIIPLHIACFFSIHDTNGFSTASNQAREKHQNDPKPIDPKYWPERFPAKEHCSKCGLCETSFVSSVDTSCAFLNEGMARIDDLEGEIHGRRRHRQMQDISQLNHDIDDEDRFGVLYQPILLARGLRDPAEDSRGKNVSVPQWTGVVTNIAISMLEQNQVDAVLCIAADVSKEGFAAPLPIIAKSVEEVKKGRGVKPSLAPSLNVLDRIKEDTSIKRLLFCGVGCSVQAFRSIEKDLGLEEVYVLGTNCADNSPTPEAANYFLDTAMNIENPNKDVLGYEFMQDYRVHVKMRPNMNASTDSIPTYKKKPYFCLPGEVATQAIAKSCLACFDYTNSLADLVVGYIAAPLSETESMDSSFQSITCRNLKGKTMMEFALKGNRIEISSEKEIGAKSSRGVVPFEYLALSTTMEDIIVKNMRSRNESSNTTGAKTMPLAIGNLLSKLLILVGPKGLFFAKYSIDYHILRNYLYVLDVWGEKRAVESLPQNAKDIVQYYKEKYSEFCDLHEEIAPSSSS